MRSDVIIEEMMTKVKHNLQNHAEKLNAGLTAENAEAVTKCIMGAVMEAAAAGFKTYIQENEIRDNTVVHDGQKYQFNRTSNKEFSTIFGKSVIERQLYRNDDGESFVPLDHAWNMENQFATLEVREAVLFAQSLMTAREARQVFDKCSTFQLAESSFKKIAEQIGPYPEGDQWYESKRLVLLEDENGAEEVYRSLLYYQKNYKYPKDRQRSLACELKFFRNNKSRMEYKRCIAGRIAPLRDNGWPIGSGVILCHQRNKLRRARVW